MGDFISEQIVSLRSLSHRLRGDVCEADPAPVQRIARESHRMRLLQQHLAERVALERVPKMTISHTQYFVCFWPLQCAT